MHQIKVGSSRQIRFNPLTYEQEALLKRGGRVGILCGTRAVQIRDIWRWVKTPLDMPSRQFERNSNVGELSKQITGLRPGADTHIYFVSDEDPWSLSWVSGAVSDLARIQRRQRIRVVFTSDEKTLWEFVGELLPRYLTSAIDEFDWVSVQPWNDVFIKRWCNDLDFQEAFTKTDELWDLSGGWPNLLNQYAVSDGKTWNAKKTQLQEYIDTNQEEILRDLGLGSADDRERLGPIMAWGTLPDEEIEACAELWSLNENVTMTAEDLWRRIFWATKLGLVHDDHEGYKLNPLVELLLRNNGT